MELFLIQDSAWHWETALTSRMLGLFELNNFDLLYFSWLNMCRPFKFTSGFNSKSSSFHWVTTIIGYFVTMVCARYMCVAIIHWTLTWTTGSLKCAQMLMHAIAPEGVLALKESLHWKLTRGKKNPLPHRGIEPTSEAWQSDALPTEQCPHPICQCLNCFYVKFKFCENMGNCILFLLTHTMSFYF